MRKFITLVLLLAAAMTSRAAEPVMPTVKGEPFIASDGKHINAHGGATYCCTTAHTTGMARTVATALPARDRRAWLVTRRPTLRIGITKA